MNIDQSHIRVFVGKVWKMASAHTHRRRCSGGKFNLCPARETQRRTGKEMVGVPWHEAIRQQVSAATEVSDLSRRLLGEYVMFTTGITFC